MTKHDLLSERGNRGALMTLAAASLSACVAESDYAPRVSGGDAERGRHALVRYECGVCHVIPNIGAAVGQVGPALDNYLQRPYVAGKFPNEPQTLVRWILDPPAMSRLTAMPAIPMAEEDARDMAAYLYEAE